MTTILKDKHCVAYKPGDAGLNAAEVETLLSQLPEWTLVNDANAIQRHFEFKNYEQTMRFVLQLSKVATQQDHHPDVSFGYNYSSVRFTTHAIKGLSENDFICAAKVDKLLARTEK